MDLNTVTLVALFDDEHARIYQVDTMMLNSREEVSEMDQKQMIRGDAGVFSSPSPSPSSSSSSSCAF